MTVIDGASNQVITTVAADTYPSALCYNPQDNKVYCANLWGDDVSVIDVASNQVDTTVGDQHSPWALCYNSHDDKLYCANSDYYNNNVTVIDGASNQVITTVTFPAGANPLCSLLQFTEQQSLLRELVG